MVAVHGLVVALAWPLVSAWASPSASFLAAASLAWASLLRAVAYHPDAAVAAVVAWPFLAEESLAPAAVAIAVVEVVVVGPTW